MSPHFEITLDGHGTGSAGDVITRDGEIIGTWTADENDFYEFIPEGQSEPVVSGYFLGLFCRHVAAWHAEQP